MLWTDLFLLWNRISHISLYLLPVNLFYPTHTPGSDCIYQKKEVSSLFTHYWLPILLILIASHIHLNLISWNRPIFLFISQNIINHLLLRSHLIPYSKNDLIPLHSQPDDIPHHSVRSHALLPQRKSKYAWYDPMKSLSPAKHP